MFATIFLMVGLAGCKSTPALKACPTRTYDASPAIAEGLEDRIAELVKAGNKASLVISEEEATAYLRHKLLHDDTARSRITFSADQICCQIDLFYLHRRVAIVSELELTTNDGHLQATLETLSLGGRAVPRWLQRSAESMLNELLVELSESIRVQSATSREGELELAFQILTSEESR